jgi:hypothetical protein
MCCEKRVIELKHHAVLVYENVLFAEGRSLAFRSPLKAHSVHQKFDGYNSVLENGKRVIKCSPQIYEVSDFTVNVKHSLEVW